MKKMFRKLSSIILVITLTVGVMPLTGLNVLADETNTDTPAATSGSEDKDAKNEEKPVATTPKNEDKPAPETQKTEDKTSETTQKEEEKPAAETPSDEKKPAESKPDNDDNTSSDTPKDEDKPSEAVPTEENKPSSDTSNDKEKPTDETPKEEEKPTGTPKDEEKPSETNPEEEKPATETPNDNDQPSSDTPEGNDNKEIPIDNGPSDTDTREPKDASGHIGTIENIKIKNGTISWAPYLHAYKYTLYISGILAEEYSEEGNDPATYSIDLNKAIDNSIKSGKLANSSTYSLELVAIRDDEQNTVLAKWTGTYSYESNATPIQVGAISGVNFANGTMTWNAFSGADHYDVYVSNIYLDWFEDNRTIEINKKIDRLIRNGEIEKSNSYPIEIRAIDDGYITIAKWSGSYSYESAASLGQPGTIENVKISNGIISWAPYDDGFSYSLSVAGCYAAYTNYDMSESLSFNLNEAIDSLIKNNEISKSSTYTIELDAFDESVILAKWTGTYSYESNATPIQVGTISGVNFTNGIMTWNAFPGTYYFDIYISDYNLSYNLSSSNDAGSLEINKIIDRSIRFGEIKKSDSYTIEIKAIDNNFITIAKWGGSYSYESTVSFGQPGAIENVKISNGIISWDPCDDGYGYTLSVSGCYAAGTDIDSISFAGGSFSFNLNETIDYLIKNNEISKSNTYSLELIAYGIYDETETIIAKWTGTYTYESSATPIQVGTISGVNFTSGTMTWNAFSGTENYNIYISGFDLNEIYYIEYFLNGRSLRINSLIEQLVIGEDIEENSSYTIEIIATDNNGYTIARWSGSYSTDSVDISTATVTGIVDKTYTGSAITQTLTVVLNDKTLTENTDYTVSYTNNTNVGEATVTITGNGIYTGTITKSFAINLPESILAVGSCGASLSWILNKDGTLTISGDGAMSNFSKAPWTDYKEYIRSVVFDGEITTIGSYAFADCTNLTEITIPNSVTSIGTAAFGGCRNIKSITIPNGVTTINKYVFSACQSLASITIPKNVTSIGEWAFHDCDTLTSITIPVSVTSIEDGAFDSCDGLTSVTISGTLTSNDEYKAKFTSVFSECKKLKSVTIHDGETSIGSYAFADCTNLTDITIPNSVTSIGTAAFGGCRNIKNITIPNGVTIINKYVFSGCQSLTSITIPKNVTSIGEWAFHDCDTLTSITIPISVTSIEDGAFDSCDGLTSVTISGTLTSNDEYKAKFTSVFSECKNLKSVTIHDGETSIGNSAFNGCKTLTSITLPDSLTTIGSYAFADCANLTEITIPNSVTSIGMAAFGGCGNIKNITIPNGVTIINKYVFSGCQSLTNITIPENVTSIGEWAFHDCKTLTSITIPVNVTSIEDGAFDSCTGLNSVVLNKSIYSNDAFPNLSSSIFHYYYNISYQSEGKGTITGEKTRTFGTDVVKLTITPSSGSVLEKVTLTAGDKTFELSPDADGNCTMPDLDTNITAEIKAWFRFNAYYSIALSDTINGTATVNVDKAAPGDEITVLATPDSGYYLSTVKVNGEVIEGTTFIMPAENVTIELEFSEKLANTLLAKGGKTAKVKYKKLRKKTQNVSRSKVMSVSNAQGKVTYGLVSVKRGKSKKYKKYIKINATTGTVSVKKKLRKGTYTITCRVTAAGDAEHKSSTKTVTFKIKVK